MATREQIEIVAREVAQRAHDRNRWQITLYPDGGLDLIERASDNEWSSDGAVLFTVGAGAFNCNCGCDGRYEIDSDDISAYVDEIERAVAEHVAQ